MNNNLIEVMRVEDRYYDLTDNGFVLIQSRFAELPMTVDYFNEVMASSNPKIYRTCGIVIDDTNTEEVK